MVEHFGPNTRFNGPKVIGREDYYFGVNFILEQFVKIPTRHHNYDYYTIFLYDTNDALINKDVCREKGFVVLVGITSGIQAGIVISNIPLLAMAVGIWQKF